MPVNEQKIGLKFSDWKEGMPLIADRRGPLTRQDLALYAAASGDNNLIHLDDNFAVQAGFPSVIAHGMLSMAYLGDFVYSSFPEGVYRVLRLSSRFRRVIFPGDTLEISGEVKKVETNKLITVHIWVKNQKGEVTTDGEADLEPASPPVG